MVSYTGEGWSAGAVFPANPIHYSLPNLWAHEGLSLKQIQVFFKNEYAVSLESCFFAEDSEFLKILN